ncbi:MAG: type II toxin-antitoxin system Phd/YefM family antitoxin [Alkaliphilus sp.]
MNVSEFRKDIFNIVKNVINQQEPVAILGKNSNKAAILVSQSDWEDMQETIFLMTHKDSRETILSAKNQPIEEGVEIDWKNGN